MALALDILKRVDISLNKENKTITTKLKKVFSIQKDIICQTRNIRELSKKKGMIFSIYKFLQSNF